MLVYAMAGALARFAVTWHHVRDVLSLAQGVWQLNARPGPVAPLLVTKSGHDEGIEIVGRTEGIHFEGQSRHDAGSGDLPQERNQSVCVLRSAATIVGAILIHQGKTVGAVRLRHL